ncbi:MAG: aldehyde dehydrogenase family protein [Myxococcota bacterium]|nr:aldehyde dehydrogenase family protein [Myxococcota bacterium]
MSESFQTLSPIDGRVYVERAFAEEATIDRALATARAAFPAWRSTPLDERIDLLRRMTRQLLDQKTLLAEELTWQMGRPLSQSPWEIEGYGSRAEAMLDLAPTALADIELAERPGFVRSLQRAPLGLILTLAPWNYPWLTAVNAVIPALAAGNVSILKHSDQTPLVAERMAEAAKAVGIPEGVFQALHCSHPQVATLVRDPRIDFVTFTGSVEGGRAVHRALAGTFKGVGLELGGKDPAYVRADADLDHAIPNLVEGVCFNSGQSCCAVERIYVHQDHFDRFVEGFVEGMKAYRLGSPLEEGIDLGPMVRTRNADHVRRQVEAASAAGARPLIEPSHFPAAGTDTPYLAPQVLTGVDHRMEIMSEETFGPAVGIMPVGGDAEALALMNDSRYGLTAAIWSSDLEATTRLAGALETGTVFMNRCDYLDPELPWTAGGEHTGKGVSLSKHGFNGVTKLKGYNMRMA